MMIKLKGENGLFWINPEAIEVVKVESDWSTVTTPRQTLTIRTNDNAEALANLLQCDSPEDLLADCVFMREWEPPF